MADLRKILADNVNEDVFQGYKTLYNDISETIDKTKKDLSDLAKDNIELQKQLMDKRWSLAKSLITEGEAIKKRKETTKVNFCNKSIKGI